MNINSKVESRLKTALLNLSSKSGIPIEELRISICKPKGSMAYKVLKGATEIRDTSISEVLNIGIDLLGIGKITQSFIERSFPRVCSENNIEQGTASYRLYMAKNGSVSGYLFSDGKAVRSVPVSDILNA